MTGYDDSERIRRLERDLAALNRLVHEQQAEIRLLRTRLGQLRASRWRKLGQRLGLAMTLDWEKRQG
jgi:predicted RNase H-like nuclease (RuvC/YqgF family)